MKALGLQVLLQEFAHKKEFTWEFVGELERPRVVRARVAPFNTKENLFAQMVVRLKYMRVCTCACMLHVDVYMHLYAGMYMYIWTDCNFCPLFSSLNCQIYSPPSPSPPPPPHGS